MPGADEVSRRPLSSPSPYSVDSVPAGPDRWLVRVTDQTGRIMLAGWVQGTAARDEAIVTLSQMVRDRPEASWRAGTARTAWELLRHGHLSAGIRQAARSRGLTAALGVAVVLLVAAFVLVPRTHPVSADTDVVPLLPTLGDLGADWTLTSPAAAQGGALPQGASRSAHVEYFQSGSQFALTADINLYPTAAAATAAAPNLLPSGVAGTQDQAVTVSGRPAHLVTFTPPNAGCTTEYAIAWQEENLVGVLYVQWKGRNGPDLGDSNPCSVGSVLGPNWVQQLAVKQLARVKPLVAMSSPGLQLADHSDVRSHRG